MIGRDEETIQIVNSLQNETPARVVILGGGRMGKTTLALSVLHAPEIVNRYKRRLFVSCEAVSSTRVLLGELANVLHIPPAQRNAHLFEQVFASFRQTPGILCLDNFETIWDDESSRSEVEELLLVHLNSITNLAIIITMRGTQRPSGLSWSKPLLPPLNPFSPNSSSQMLETLCGSMDEYTEMLLKAVDGIPLAI
jgi:hypothetical protein